MTDRAHNYGQRCTKAPHCNCSRCCLCYKCLFDRRARSLYSGMQSRLKERKWKSGRNEGKVRVEKREVPYTLEQFKAWLRVVLEDSPHCEYCGIAISITTISPDHAKPMKRGGSLELKNLRGCCQSCQNGKADLLPGEWMFLLKCVATMPEPARVSIMRRLRGGILHFGNRAKTP